MSVIQQESSHLSYWFDLPAHWRAARWGLRTRAVLLPFVTLAALLFDAMLGLVFSALVIFICFFAAAIRLLLQPFRRGEPTTLLAWRLPLAALIAILSVMLAMSSYNQATRDARDIIVAIDEDIRNESVDTNWICGDQPKCRLALGYAWVSYSAMVSRREDLTEYGGSDFQVLLYLGPDDSITFTTSKHDGINIVSRSDLRIRTLDPATLETIPNSGA